MTLESTMQAPQPCIRVGSTVNAAVEPTKTTAHPGSPRTFLARSLSAPLVSSTVANNTRGSVESCSPSPGFTTCSTMWKTPPRTTKRQARHSWVCRMYPSRGFPVGLLHGRHRIKCGERRPEIPIRWPCIIALPTRYISRRD